jgi:hypothetical protein
MNAHEIKQLLERYWACETSLKEEQELITFFSENEPPEELKVYQPLFALITAQSAIKAPKKLMNGMQRPLSRRFYPSMPSLSVFYPAMKIAVSILILLTVGVGFYTHYQQERQMDRIFMDTCADPEDAVKETARAIAKVSSVLQLVGEKSRWNNALDSIRLKKQDFLDDESIRLPE